MNEVLSFQINNRSFTKFLIIVDFIVKHILSFHSFLFVVNAEQRQFVKQKNDLCEKTNDFFETSLTHWFFNFYLKQPRLSQVFLS